MQYRLIIGNRNYSSWSMRGWLLLRAFDIPFDCEVVSLRSHEWDRFIADHPPARTVPTLQVENGSGSFLMWDSLAIAEFLHEQHPRAGIWPDALDARAAARAISAEMHSGFAALRDSMPMNLRRVYRHFSPQADALFDIRRIETLWEWAGSNWGDHGAYLFGDRFCAADVFYAPVASRLRTYAVELDANSQLYVDALLNHPAVREFYREARDETWVLPHVEFDE